MPGQPRLFNFIDRRSNAEERRLHRHLYKAKTGTMAAKIKQAATEISANLGVH